MVGYAASGNPWAGLSGGWWVFTYALFCVAQVWIWDVTMRLDKARTAEAEVAVLRERLRFAGDLHDIQGHQLQAIALKAQLAARLIGVDDARARSNAEDAHALALEALAETRELVQGYRRVGLATELANAVGILKAAGVEAAVEGTPEAVPVALQPLFGSLVREGATNLLRHTRAERCEIAVEREGDDVVVRMADDGVAREAGPGRRRQRGRRPARALRGRRRARRGRAAGRRRLRPHRPRAAPGRMIRLLLADDEDLVREALATLLELEPDFKVVAQAGDGERAVELAAEHQPDLVVLDLEMPGLDGVAAASRILARATGPGRAAHPPRPPGRPAPRAGRRRPRVRAQDDPGGPARADPARRPRRRALCRLRDRRDRAYRGHLPADRARLDVLRHVREGASASAIADRVHLAPGTVRNYICSAMAKLNAPTRAEAARIAYEEGWI